MLARFKHNVNGLCTKSKGFYQSTNIVTMKFDRRNSNTFSINWPQQLGFNQGVRPQSFIQLHIDLHFLYLLYLPFAHLIEPQLHDIQQGISTRIGLNRFTGEQIY